MRRIGRQASAQQGGFTLVEIMASIVVLAIVGLALSAYFINALDNAKGNQNKTVMVNLARNTLFYIQKQADFKKIREQIDKLEDGQNFVLNSEGCSDTAHCSAYETYVSDPDSLTSILNPVINDIHYRVEISYQESLYATLQSDVQSGGKISDYLIPVRVEIEELTPDEEGNLVVSDQKREKTEVEGYIADEKIR
ncbi:prepilin-type N-terminal cleavage/methylation domain-containing protein [Paenibacillus phyllosphaerae]|uniref:Prepilin-type N-terminal cleavage/methylation domain-containing protein n=1 Tax=Paenibacillus phyllosphaerae TaxID=274593 RepID=A0A7W5AUY8_9BACL|nr:type II secretion system protein [Paenibacillus phyllosphaerae]MBB3108736.1 prepilin-type N-terminal cleavage/methylation domain-containing protein [Paenibacillus phyllosphaerae]